MSDNQAADLMTPVYCDVCGEDLSDEADRRAGRCRPCAMALDGQEPDEDEDAPYHGE